MRIPHWRWCRIGNEDKRWWLVLNWKIYGVGLLFCTLPRFIFFGKVSLPVNINQSVRGLVSWTIGREAYVGIVMMIQAPLQSPARNPSRLNKLHRSSSARGVHQRSESTTKAVRHEQNKNLSAFQFIGDGQSIRSSVSSSPPNRIHCHTL